MSQHRSYTSSFFNGIADISLESARHVVPVLMDLLRPCSVIDVGCGTGGWLSVFSALGVRNIAGIDGNYVDRSQLRIPTDCFTPKDLSKPFNYSDTFDLAMSVEVGEHLPEHSSRQFVAELTCLAHVVAFSAAVPYQGGVEHCNEQWPEYWAERFRNFGFVAVDAIRHRIWNNERIAWYYRQNLILYVREDRLESYPLLAQEYSSLMGTPLSLVHPAMYAGLLYTGRPENIRVTEAAKLFGKSLKAALARRLRGKGNAS